MFVNIDVCIIMVREHGSRELEGVITADRPRVSVHGYSYRGKSPERVRSARRSEVLLHARKSADSSWTHELQYPDAARKLCRPALRLHPDPGRADRRDRAQACGLPAASPAHASEPGPSEAAPAKDMEEL